MSRGTLSRRARSGTQGSQMHVLFRVHKQLNMFFGETSKKLCLVPWPNLLKLPVSQHLVKKSALTVRYGAVRVLRYRTVPYFLCFVLPSLGRCQRK